MGLLAPGFLFGLLAAGLPLYLHLLKRHTATPMPFSSLMFFERRTESSVRHKRLRHLLLLGLRLALLGLLALAFAQPVLVLKTPAVGDSGALVAVALDNSFSMKAGNRMEEARRQALQLTGRLPAGRRAQILAVNSRVTLMSQPISDQAELRSAILAVEPGDFRSSYAELARALRSVAEAAGTSVEAHFFTDGQRSSLPASFQELGLPDGVSLQIHSVVRQAEPNFTVESVSAPRRVLSTERVRVEATIASYADFTARKRVSLAVGGRIQRTTEITVEARGKAVVEFLGLDVPYGWSRCEVRIEGGDALPEDDVYRFSVERSDPKKVLWVSDGARGRGLLYARAALEAGGEPAFALQPVRWTDAPPHRLDSAAFIVLEDPAGLPGPWVRALEDYVRTGGSLWITLGPAAAAHGTVPVSGEPILRLKTASRAGESFLVLGEADRSHPSIENTRDWQGVRFYQRATVQTGEARVVARLTDGAPVLYERRIGEGRVLVFASTLDNLSNDFPLHAAFVPFVRQTAHYLAGESSRAPVYTVGQALELRKEKGKAEAIEAVGPRGERLLSLEQALTAQSLPLEDSGYYEVNWPGGRRELVAVNVDRRESDLTTADTETLSLWQGRKAAQKAPNPSAVGGGTQRRDLWWWLLLAALAVAAVEAWVARKYLSPDALGEETLEEGAA